MSSGASGRTLTRAQRKARGDVQVAVWLDGTEDHDTGIILGERTGLASGYVYYLVGWDSGVKTECLAYQLRVMGGGR